MGAWGLHLVLGESRGESGRDAIHLDWIDPASGWNDVGQCAYDYGAVQAHLAQVHGDPVSFPRSPFYGRGVLDEAAGEIQGLLRYAQAPRGLSDAQRLLADNMTLHAEWSADSAESRRKLAYLGESGWQSLGAKIGYRIEDHWKKVFYAWHDRWHQPRVHGR